MPLACYHSQNYGNPRWGLGYVITTIGASWEMGTENKNNTKGAGFPPSLKRLGFHPVKLMKYIAVFFILMGCDWWNNWYPSDNPIEEIAEQVIEQETGLDLDLSPNTPERVHPKVEIRK